MSFLAILSAGIGIAFIGQVAGCLLTRTDGWDRATGLLIAMAAMPLLVLATRPGDFSPHEDFANGLLLMLLMMQTVGLWAVAAVGALVLHAPARSLADRLHQPRAGEPEDAP